MSLARKLKCALFERCGGSRGIGGCWNARAVVINGRQCVAKLVPYLSTESPQWNARQRRKYRLEKRVYSMLPRSWPIKLVDAFESDIGGFIVTSAYENTGWCTYVPSHKTDSAVAKQLVAQIDTIHSTGIAHADLELKNILFQKPSGVAIIDFEKSNWRKRAQIDDYVKLVQSLLEFDRANTRGIAFCIIELLIERGDRATAKHALVSAVGYMNKMADYMNMKMAAEAKGPVVTHVPSGDP
jgi:serine/threonine protein kinase